MDKPHKFNDYAVIREKMHKNIEDSFNNKVIQNKNTFVTFSGVKVNPKGFSKEQQKNAILGNRSLGVPVTGTINLHDKESGKIIEKKTMRLASVPFYTERGTFINSGNEYAIGNQFRLKPGVYTRVKENEELEAHLNIQAGTGRSFRILLEPQTGIFRFVIAQAKIPVYPIFKFMLFSDQELEKAWGKELLTRNKKYDSASYLDQLYVSLFGKKPSNIDNKEKVAQIVKVYNKASMDAKVNQGTIGVSARTINPNLLLLITKKLIKISRGDESTSDRDSLEHREILGVEDFLPERIDKDAGSLSRKLGWKSDTSKNLSKVVEGYYTPSFEGFVKRSALPAATEQLNPMEILESGLKITPLGEGGLGLESVPESLRNLHSSHFGFVDPIRTPESEKSGIVLTLGMGVRKGLDKNLLTEVLTRDGKKKLISPEEAINSIIAFPGQELKGFVKAMKNKKVIAVSADKVKYMLPASSNMFTATTNLTPFLHSTSGNRALLSARMIPAALPLKNPEAPLVQSWDKSTGQSFDQRFGKETSAAISPTDGVITQITENIISIKDQSGGVHKVELYKNFPYNRKTGINQEPIVKKGDKIKKGQVVARSNFTDEKGVLAYGKNLNVGYLSYKGYNFEDGVVVSESAAEALSSEHTYQVEIELSELLKVGKENFVSYFPNLYSQTQLVNLDQDGVAKKGAKIKFGDPVILVMEKRLPTATDLSLGMLHKSLKFTFINVTEEWEHHGEGEVIDINKAARHYKVVVRVYEKAIVGDKVTGRHGNKGVIAKILPDDHMPRNKASGEPLQVLLNPQGIVTRTNPSQLFETAMGKIAKKTGEPQYIDNFGIKNSLEYVKDKLKKYSLSDTEEIEDPLTGKTIGNIETGYQYILKPASTAEKSISYRSTENYSSEMSPIKGKAIGQYELNSLIAHNARKVIKDVYARKSEKNDEQWEAVRSGLPLPPARQSFMTKKFLSSLQASGVNVKREGDFLQALPMTDKDITALSSGVISNDKMIRADLRPERGGIMDESITGGLKGENWSHVELYEPLPNPIMEKQIRILLGNISEVKFRNVLIGKEEFNGVKGGEGIKKLLQKINVNVEIENEKRKILNGRKTERDNAIKRLRVLQGLKNTNTKPEELMLKKVPVIPPTYRPVQPSTTGVMLVADANHLYRDVILSNDKAKSLMKHLPNEDEDVQGIRGSTYDSVKAVYGLSGSITLKLKIKNIKGHLKQIIGDSPKFGMFQRKILRKTQDFSGRAVIIPDPKLGIDQAGLPEEIAWGMYAPFVIKKMVEAGYTKLEAGELLDKKDEKAKVFLLKAMDERPILVNRAPSLHKYNIMALKPQITNERVLSLPPLIEKGFNADHDGDAMNIHVPISDEAVQEANEKLLPSVNLFEARQHKAYWVPEQEAILGIARATKLPIGIPKKKFKDKKEALLAYNRKEIDLNTSIEIQNLN